ncbi:putative transcription factor B3-Domain family [Helianthus annuus]|uniref:Transcription factor B3-Domain family n=1 Tax=Helianthus annuus TaxID=4232 RepID=A0A9K3E9F6_HELAN|nr:putative transcription factor B3-Domain family [Helianthus annuus]KAJ0659430.1 putative transcription factor B3-Domain family [Helianthus annuus]KAJ0839756.1 putative transcription factor B3-Domain family [Helianthus annuus]KAJ0853093.1 putative transcription factor B3-Domain family [Helianthus annuus]
MLLVMKGFLQRLILEENQMLLFVTGVCSKVVADKVRSMPLVEETSKSSSMIFIISWYRRKKKKAMPKSKAVRSVSENSHIAFHTRSNVSKNNECVVIDIVKPAKNITAKPKRKACRSITSMADVVSRKRSTVKRLKTNAFFEFTKTAESRLNLRSELTNMSTRAEKSGDGYMYGFTKWSAFLKSNHIQFGATLFFKYVKSSQLLMLTKVVHKTTKKRGRA